MSNHIVHLLNVWYPIRDQYQWVLGSVYATQGSSYRKAGSYMLFNDAGQKYGLLSGGCLEADLHHKARQVMLENRALTLQYDTSDEDDINFILGLGCGGVVDILLQPINSTNNYLQLIGVWQLLKAHATVEYRQKIPIDKWGEAISTCSQQSKSANSKSNKAYLDKTSQENWLVSTISSNPHLLVIGGGIDARPLVAIAVELGWEVTVVDPRPANARLEHFPLANQIKKHRMSELANQAWLLHVNAAVIMSHSIDIDADALVALAKQKLDYCALLGPKHRQQQVLEKAKITKKTLSFKLAGPAGLDIGAELPESIALAILAECHAKIFKRNAHSLSNVLN